MYKFCKTDNLCLEPSPIQIDSLRRFYKLAIASHDRGQTNHTATRFLFCAAENLSFPLELIKDIPSDIFNDFQQVLRVYYQDKNLLRHLGDKTRVIEELKQMILLDETAHFHTCKPVFF